MGGNKMRIFITSDHHFNHKNIIKYCKRPYKSVFEMNEDMIDKWNKVVSKEDFVYHLGDFAFAKNPSQIKEIRSRLDGEIFLIPGNHDNKSYLKKAGIKISDGCRVAIKNLILTHRPLDDIKKGFVNVHGHIHEKDTFGRRMNVSVDVTNFEPKPIEYCFKKAKFLLEIFDK